MHPAQPEGTQPPHLPALRVHHGTALLSSPLVVFPEVTSGVNYLVLSRVAHAANTGAGYARFFATDFFFATGLLFAAAGTFFFSGGRITDS